MSIQNNNIKTNCIYYADLYLRLSKKDSGKRDKSESIENQEKLIQSFLKTHPEIVINDLKIDDGYSGTDFNRPAFKEMLSDIKKGIINCIIVKDLSRLGREYIQTGIYVEQIFPMYGIRFIAINDGIDQVQNNNQANAIIVPVKNFVNDEYCRDASIKIRSHMDVLRTEGKFIGSASPYGYLRSDINRHKLVVDDYAADVVREIFNLKLNGYSSLAISDKLNQRGILPPAMYKRSLGLNFKCHFQISQIPKWSAVAVGRILKNRVYIGTLEQGKSSRPNHKIKKQQKKDEKDWICVAHQHDLIISESIFEAVQRLVMQDTKKSINKDIPYVLSGFLKCGDCGENMVRKLIPKNGKTYEYYVCSTYQGKKGCTSHSVNAEKLEAAVFLSLKTIINNMLYFDKVIEVCDSAVYRQSKLRRLDCQLKKKQEEYCKYNERIVELGYDLRNNIIEADDYKIIKNAMTDRLKDIGSVIRMIKHDMANPCNFNGEALLFLKNNQDIKALDRKLVAVLIKEIIISKNGNTEIVLSCRSEYERTTEPIKKTTISEEVI